MQDRLSLLYIKKWFVKEIVNFEYKNVNFGILYTPRRFKYKYYISDTI